MLVDVMILSVTFLKKINIYKTSTAIVVQNGSFFLPFLFFSADFFFFVHYLCHLSYCVLPSGFFTLQQ